VQKLENAEEQLKESKEKFRVLKTNISAKYNQTFFQKEE
jgi:hypothetical protein